MTGWVRKLWLATALAAVGSVGMAIEEAVFTVVRADGDYQLRDYAPQVVAETVVEGELDSAGSAAFSPLFGYITGKNSARSKYEMTAPVAQRPVAGKDRWAVSFLMPAGNELDKMPAATDPRVQLRQIPAQRMAVVRYSGTWSIKNYQQHKQALEGWIVAQGLKPAGEAVWARYNAPFTPWFMRRNEILVPVN
jgi:hypothetical protein